MSRKQFSNLLKKYHRGECTPQEKRFVENWFGLLGEEPGEDEHDPDWLDLEETMWNRLHVKIQESEKENPGSSPSGIIRFVWVGLAASVIAVATAAVLYRHQLMSSLAVRSMVAAAWVDHVNHSDHHEIVRLEDGSMVDLSPGSSVKYPVHFSQNKRVVVLKGKAFFDISKSPDRPFFVYSDHMVTRVLGTRFYVEEQKEIGAPQVEVLSGAVAVYENVRERRVSTGNVVLKSNQKAMFLLAKHQFVTGLVETPNLLVTGENKDRFRFYNTPLSTVLENLHVSYGIDIILQNRKMATCPLTANLTGQPLYTQLDIICAALNASYQIEGTRILVGGKGCKEHYITNKT